LHRAVDFRAIASNDQPEAFVQRVPLRQLVGSLRPSPSSSSAESISFSAKNS
jgi:hypothetical protein